MQIYELTLVGFDGDTDATDYLVKHVKASLPDLYKFIRDHQLFNVVDSIGTAGNFSEICVEEGDIDLTDNPPLKHINEMLSRWYQESYAARAAATH